MSETTVDVPAVGSVKKQYVIAAVALVAGIVGYAYWRAGQAPSDYPAYTEEDIAADGIADTPAGSAGGSANSGGASHDNSTTPDSDSEWARMATEALAGAFELSAVQTALGRYITRQSVTAAQEDIIRAAIGAMGYPPGGQYPIMTGTGSTPSALTEPKNVKATAKTATTITLTWSAVPSAAGYRVYRSGVAGNVGQSVDGTITIGGLTPGKSYTFHVRAQDASGKTGPRSADVTASTAGAKLTAPSKVRVTGATKSTVTLSWSAVAGADGYRAYRSGVTQNVGASRDTSMTVGGLKPNTTYQIRVAATAGTTTGPTSGWVRAKTKK